MRILLMADLSGASLAHTHRARPALAERLPVDVDLIDDVMARLAPCLHLPFEGETPGTERVELRCLDDFHPDTLYRRLDVFQRLRETRERLLDPTTFAQAAAELRTQLEGMLPVGAPRDQKDLQARGTRERVEDDAATLARLLGSRPARVDPARTHAGIDVASLIQRIVGPQSLPSTPHQEVYLRALDEVITGQMRSVLRAPGFQALESTWRAVHWLISRLETGEDLRIYLLDVTQQELAADLREAAEVEASRLHKRLVEDERGTLGGEPWSLLVANFSFGPGLEDIVLLEALGALAARAGGPLLAAADPALLGCSDSLVVAEPRDWKPLDPDAEKRWQALRRSPSAPWIGLALPRVLLRLPYGRHTDPIEDFDFDEMGPVREHEAYLWGNPAFACALLLTRACLKQDGETEPGDELDIEDLPAHTYLDDGESKLQACAEVYLSERAAHAILARGLIPILSYKNRNAARIARFQSIAEPLASLAGHWG